MTRIVAGALGGRRLTVPTGSHTRPTSDRVREALFNTLETLIDLDGARVADLYAGSGAVGLEALSRGAAHALLIEHDAKAGRIIRSNIAALDARDRAVLQSAKVGTALAAGPAGEPYDLVFADPPYPMTDLEVLEMLAALLEHGWLAEDALVVVERSSRGAGLAWVEGITAVRSRKYGETTLWYGRRS
ncbi:16S rRNA (guanine(966)-N(2))-methyltransferase RsmD [Catenuloplanes indicus]|uniref:16S rRNA (Guanine(966)-N(2))-methyltransferase RsmD n=1 Tax=Catenuloplanes indicus TaxID=137267 RepID=A0AAE3W410_9ACTN|nr:16S rRNA (guanine(966)-N(2))-methyltransferase RsmD [Catenuloplanes indicus]MDQ0369039.1 16S rRNA (guanine(966)-N(2))-methyltransferase RsmD [Catenuloplanes indicus]